MPETASKKDQITKRWIIFTLGMFLMGTGIALIIKAGMGVSAMSSVTKVMTLVYPPLSLGTYSFLLNFALFIGEFIVNPRYWSVSKLAQLIPTFVSSVFIDLNMWIFTFLAPSSYLMKCVVLIAGCVVFGLSLALMISADAILMPTEAFISVVAKKTGKEWGNIKTGLDVSLVIIAALISLAAFHKVVAIREGTIICALTIGTISRFFRKYTNKLFLPKTQLQTDAVSKAAKV